MATGSGSGLPAPGGGRVTVNVGALMQAIASAIQEATAPQGRGKTGDMSVDPPVGTSGPAPNER